jgi:hypothetical protein
MNHLWQIHEITEAEKPMEMVNLTGIAESCFACRAPTDDKIRMMLRVP